MRRYEKKGAYKWGQSQKENHCRAQCFGQEGSTIMQSYLMYSIYTQYGMNDI